MSLFDDILPQNKPNPPVQDDPLAITPQITITESVPMNMTPPPIETPSIEALPDTPTPVAQIPVDSSGILIIDEAESVSPLAPVSEVSNVPSLSPTSSVPSPSFPPSSTLFSLVSDTPSSPVSDVPNVSILSPTSSVPSTPSTAFQTTEDLIAHEISDLDEFILSLDAVDRAKLEQEAEYKSQKEHFAELELQAESEHQKVLTERSHAEKMRAYLEAESKGENIEKPNIKKSSKSLV